MPHTAGHTANPELDRCIDDCYSCATSCGTTLSYCLEQGGKHAEAKHIALMFDCSAICETAAGSMARNSDAYGQICRVCAQVCRACEKDCRSFRDDSTMQACVDACRTCAENCERMAA